MSRAHERVQSILHSHMERPREWVDTGVTAELVNAIVDAVRGSEPTADPHADPGPEHQSIAHAINSHFQAVDTLRRFQRRADADENSGRDPLVSS